MINFLPSEIEPAPSYGAHLESDFIKGMGKRDDQLNILIDIEKVVNWQEASNIASMTEKSSQ